MDKLRKYFTIRPSQDPQLASAEPQHVQSHSFVHIFTFSLHTVSRASRYQWTLISTLHEFPEEYVCPSLDKIWMT